MFYLFSAAIAKIVFNFKQNKKLIQAQLEM